MVVVLSDAERVRSEQWVRAGSTPQQGFSKRGLFWLLAKVKQSSKSAKTCRCSSAPPRYGGDEGANKALVVFGRLRPDAGAKLGMARSPWRTS